MDPDVDARFAHQLSIVGENLLDRITDRSSLTTLNDQWMSLVDNLNNAIETQALSSSTISTAYVLAQRVSKVAETFFDLDVLSEDLISTLALETSSIMDSPVMPIISQCSDHPPTQIPSYIKPSYDWLLKNIHDPYPSIQTRDNIASETGSARKDVDGWFVDARKRIKWNTLRKTRFSNKRAEIVDAAARFFVEDDPKRPLDPNVELEFAAIETRAKALYSAKFSGSDLAAKLDMVVKDMTPEMKVLVKEERRRLLLQKDDDCNVQKRRPTSSYPSPDRSPNRSPEPDLPSPNLPCDVASTVVSELPSGRKRQNSRSDPSDYSDNRPNKRPRLDVPPSSLNGLPSPASSFHEGLDGPDSTATPMLSNVPPTPLNRKRRLADTEVQGAPKHPRNLLVGSQLHDPLPVSTTLLEASAFDSWFNKHFESPTTATVDELDASIPVHVEFCDTSIFKADALLFGPSTLSHTCEFWLSSALTCHPTVSAPASSEVPVSVIPASISSSPSLLQNLHEAPTLSLDVCSTEFDFTDFLASNDFMHSFYEQDVVDGQGYSLPFVIPPLDIGFPLNAFNPYFMPPAPNVDDPVLSEASMPISTHPSSEVDWPFSQFMPSCPPLPNVSSEVDFQDLLNMFPPTNSFESFDPIMLNATQSNNETADAALTDRAAKEKQLQEMKEAARRLEEELAASR